MTGDYNHLDIETLSAYADGELNAAAATRAERHIAECAACRDVLRRVRELVGAAGALPRDIAPPPEVWASLRARLAREPAHRAGRWWHNGWLAAAAALVLVVGTAVVTSNTAPKAKASKLPGQLSSADRSPPNAVFAVDRNYVATVDQLRETLEVERERLSPSAVRTVERSLSVIDSAIAEAREALASDPANRTLVDILSAHYERKVELLQRATELSSL